MQGLSRHTPYRIHHTYYSMKLVIVESPTKAKTISRFLGKEYTVESSYGHVRDLPKSKLGVDVEKNFEPTYIIPKANQKRLTALKKKAAKADEVLYATDEDREGEAIAWHLAQAFELPNDAHKRITFHEITKPAIMAALEQPRTIDKHLVDAQQARRVLDRLVGYKLSPFLWKKVARGLSAGRVQSVAVRLIVERQREIDAFNPEEYWTIEAEMNAEGKVFAANLFSMNGQQLEKFSITNTDQATAVVEALKDASYTISSIEQTEQARNPLAPFRTSTLQQEANRRLGFSAKQTMMVAQQLYEGLDTGEGAGGLITYMRTDSLNLSGQFIGQARDFIEQQYGQEYLFERVRQFKGKAKGAQEAHEAIRPTDVRLTPDSLATKLSAQQLKLYRLIWQRAVATQMAPAKLAQTTIIIDASTGKHQFKATGQMILERGFLAVYPLDVKETELPPVTEQQAVDCQQVTPEQHFTKPPAYYSDASLVKALEEKGIGRPSTYAPTINTIITRGYVERDGRKLVPMDIAMLVNDLLVEHFPKVVDYDFTADIEEDFDEVAEGKQKWQGVIEEFYQPFIENLDKKSEELSKKDIAEVQELGTDPDTKEPIFVKVGRFGPYVQLGEAKEDGEKPKFASIPKGKPLQKVTLQDALKYLSLPRTVGADADGNAIEVAIGRFGPYAKCDGTFYSLGEDDDPYTVTLERVQEIMAEQKEKKQKALIADFKAEGIQVKTGRFGPYVTDGKVNAKVPKDVEPEKLTVEDCKELLEKKKAGKGGRKKVSA